MYEFWCDYVKPKYQDNAKLCYMDTDSFIIYIKTEDICADIAKDVEQDLVLQVFNQKDHYLKEKINKSN